MRVSDMHVFVVKRGGANDSQLNQILGFAKSQGLITFQGEFDYGGNKNPLYKCFPGWSSIANDGRATFPLHEIPRLVHSLYDLLVPLRDGAFPPRAHGYAPSSPQPPPPRSLSAIQLLLVHSPVRKEMFTDIFSFTEVITQTVEAHSTPPAGGPAAPAEVELLQHTIRMQKNQIQELFTQVSKLAGRVRSLEELYAEPDLPPPLPSLNCAPELGADEPSAASTAVAGSSQPEEEAGQGEAAVLDRSDL